MDYLAWNDRLAAKFFTATSQGKRVYLFVTKELISEIGADAQCGLPEFVEAIKLGPKWTSDGGICKKAEDAFENWRLRKLPYPPYIAYLAFFSLAAGIEGDFAVHAYYPRLRSLLGEVPTAGTYSGFTTMRGLWYDLETWTQQDLRGRLGFFQADIAGRLIHVGLPISQMILSESERLALPSIFASGGLEPTSTPSAPRLAVLLLRNRENLRSSTVRVLSAKSSHEEEFEALVDAVALELAEWDGAISDPADGQGPGSGGLSGTATLWCERLDPVAKSMRVRVVCRTRNEFPEDGIVLQLIGHSGVYQCEERVVGWSEPLRSDDGQVLDASTLDWTAGARLRDVSGPWRFSLPASPVRILISAAAEGLPGYLETHSLPPETQFLVLVHQEHRRVIEQWGRDSCIGFKGMPVDAGLPAGWLLYSADRAVDDEIVSDLFAVLSLPHTARIEFKGGLSTSANTYFPFALPNVVVSGVPVSAELICNGQTLGPCTVPLFQIPAALSSDGRLAFEIQSGDRVMRRRSLYTEADFQWPQSSPIMWFDRLGRTTTDLQGSRTAGPLVVSDEVPPFSDWITSPEPQIRFDPDDVAWREDERAPSVEQVDEPAIAFVSESELRRLVAQWKTEVEEGAQTPLPGSLSSREYGRHLTEGTAQYLIACRRHDARRNLDRAIGELSRASHSADPTVWAIAVALLQLALHRSGRREKATALGQTELPPNCGRLQSFMAMLGGVDCPGGPAPDGIGISDVSPFAEDAELERRLFSSVPARLEE